MTEAITIRRATQADAGRVRRLAELDSSTVPVGTAVLAEMHGELVAAVSERDGRAIADPFVPTADVVAVLKRVVGR
jgi:hypothetical protein